MVKEKRNYKKPAQKTGYLRIRINPILKEKLQEIVNEKYEYSTLSDLIRDILTDYIGGKLVPISSIKFKESKEVKSEIDQTIELLQEIKKIKKNQNRQENMISAIFQHYENGQLSYPEIPVETMTKHDIEAEIIRLIKIKPMKSEELGEIFKITEPRILKFINPLLKSHIIGFNNKMEYILIEIKENICPACNELAKDFYDEVNKIYKCKNCGTYFLKKELGINEVK